MHLTVGVSRAKNDLPSLLNEVANGRRTVIERRGRPVAAIVSMEDFELVERTAPAVTHPALARPKGALVLVGALADLDDQELDAMVADIYQQRLKDPKRTMSG